MRDPFFDAKLNQAFFEVGFVKVPLLGEREVAELLQRFHTLKPDDAFDPSTGPHVSMLDTNRVYKQQAQQIIFECMRPAVGRLVRDYRPIGANFHVKLPGKGPIMIHNHWPTVEDLDETTLNVWAPLVDTTTDNGTLHVVAGSHKIVRDVSTPCLPQYFHGLEELLIKKYLRPISLRAGEALIFDDSLIHYSGSNNSSNSRIAVQYMVIPSECQQVFYRYNRAEPTFMDIHETDEKFTIDNTVIDLIQKPNLGRKLRRVPNINRILNQAEFERCMREGPARREKLRASSGCIQQACG